MAAQPRQCRGRRIADPLQNSGSGRADEPMCDDIAKLESIIGRSRERRAAGQYRAVRRTPSDVRNATQSQARTSDILW
jgi:hypothetical protein